MAKASLNDFIRRLTRGMAVSTLADHSDRQLVERALAERDEAAFQAIVRRHGPMVYRVCWRVSEHPQDAEDAFQATFLVLAQKLPTLRKQASLASWLHGIAHRVALKAKAETGARRRREQRASQASARPPDDVTWGELRSALDGELSRLPNKWREPLILCYLEGRTQEEAAGQLGWSKSTLRRRLEEARTALADRLTRRGIVVPAALSAVLFSDCLASAVSMPRLMAATAEAAASAAAGKTAAVSAKAAVLAEGVLKAMFVTKLKLTAALVLVVGVFAAGTAGVGLPFVVGEPPKEPINKGKAHPAAPLTEKEVQRNDGPDDAQRLQGEWQIVDWEKGGKRVAEDPAGQRIVFKGSEFTFFGGKNTFRLDTKASPHELHVTILGGEFKGQTYRAIYSLEQNELKLCMPLGPKVARPTEFKTGAGSNLVLLVLRRASDDGRGAKKPDEAATIKRDWVRGDVPPDGNYKLCYADGYQECTSCLIKLETKDSKQSASLLGAAEDEQITAVRNESPVWPLSPVSAGQAPAKGVPIRLVCTTPRGDWVFEGSFSPPSLEARGHFEGADIVLPAILSATDLKKLKFTMRDFPPTPLRKALGVGGKVDGLRQRAQFAEDAEKKARLMQQAALAEAEARAEAPKLYREGFEKYADHPLVFQAAVGAAQCATRYQIPAEQLRAMIAKADQTAATYGPRWRREFNLQVTAALAPQKDYAAMTLEIATRLEKELIPSDAASVRQRVLKALAVAQGHAGQSAAKEALAGLLAKVEETLDREYRAKVPPFKPVSFAGRKSKSDRAVVLELFTGTQCPPCVAAGVAFDALHETYRPSELVLLQYHLHIPGPDPLANADSEARFAYYAKSFPKEALGVPTTFFNGKPEGGGGGQMAHAEEKYKQYRQVIDPLLETSSSAKLSASALRQGNQINIQVEVTDLQKPGNVRLRLLLVEEMVRYAGPNRVRFHHHVVRSMIGGADGFALNDKVSTHTATVDLEALRTSLNHYLDDYNDNWRSFPNLERPLDLADLRLIALVQDDATREILQARQVQILAQGKTAAKE